MGSDEKMLFLRASTFLCFLCFITVSLTAGPPPPAPPQPAPPPPEGCPEPDWIDLGVGCYHFSRAWPMTYDKAASYCINMGMHSARKIAIIAEPTNSLIQERLKIVASNMKLGDLWIGGREYEKYGGEGAWRWEAPVRPLTYTNWAPGKPSDHNHLNCLILSAENDYQWVDEDCERGIRPICQLIL